MYLVEYLAVCEIGLSEDILVECGVDLGDTAVVMCILGRVACTVHISYGGMIAVVELRVEPEPVDYLPVYGYGVDVVPLGALVLHVLHDVQRMREVRRSCSIIVAVLVIDRP